MIGFIENLAKQAGEVLLSHFGEDTQLLKLRCSVKEAVTKYDKMVDELIIREIRERYPHHSLLTEESGLLKGDPDWLWIVDVFVELADKASSSIAQAGQALYEEVLAVASGKQTKAEIIN